MTEARRATLTALLAAAAAGSLFSLSFVATPVKFLAQDVPLAQLLAVGRVTFRASLALESLLLAGLILSTRGSMRRLVWSAAGMLALQWLLLMPPMDTRTLARMAGEHSDPSSLHYWWVALDMLRLGIYFALMRMAMGFSQRDARPTGSES